jgi:hypothetical protein
MGREHNGFILGWSIGGGLIFGEVIPDFHLRLWKRAIEEQGRDDLASGIF